MDKKTMQAMRERRDTANSWLKYCSLPFRVKITQKTAVLCQNTREVKNLGQNPSAIVPGVQNFIKAIEL